MAILRSDFAYFKLNCHRWPAPETQRPAVEATGGRHV